MKPMIGEPEEIDGHVDPETGLLAKHYYWDDIKLRGVEDMDGNYYIGDFEIAKESRGKGLARAALEFIRELYFGVHAINVVDEAWPFWDHMLEIGLVDSANDFDNSDEDVIQFFWKYIDDFGVPLDWED